MVEPLIKQKDEGKKILGAIKSSKQKAEGGDDVAAKNVKLNAAQIIEMGAAAEMPGKGKEILVGVSKMIQSGKAQMVQIGNTVFLLRPKSPGAVEFHTLTVEPPQKLVDRYKSFNNTLKQMGYKKAYSYSTSPAFVRIAKQTGLPVQITQSQMMQGNQMVPAYQFEVTL
jgi:hypothetical protein